MLTIQIAGTDDEPSVELNLEHSLVSLSKWESLHEKPFFGREGMDYDETLSYIDQMVLTEFPPEGWVYRLEIEDLNNVTAYINSKQTATWFREDSKSRQSREIITNELIYYWMIDFGIPFDPCETWHVNRLMTLIKICGIKRTKPRRMSRQAQAEEMRQLNAQRRAQLGTSG